MCFALHVFMGYDRVKMDAFMVPEREAPCMHLSLLKGGHGQTAAAAREKD